MCMRKTKIKVYASASVFDNKNKNSFCWYGTMSVWYDGKYGPSYSSRSRAANENLPQFVALCKKVQCSLINQNSGPPSNKKNNNFTLFYYKHKAHTFLWHPATRRFKQTNCMVDAFRTCFHAMRLITQMSHPNERSAAFWVAQKSLAATTTSQPELMSLSDNCSWRWRPE